MERTVAELGCLDTLINNAGVMLFGPMADAPLPEWRQMVQLNVLGPLYCAHATLPVCCRPAAASRARSPACEHQLGGGPGGP